MALALRSLAVKRPGGATLISLFSSASRRPSSSFSATLVRPLAALAEPLKVPLLTRRGPEGFRCFSVSRTSSSLNDPSPNWSNRPPKETILLDGCDFEHWLVVVEPPDPNLTRDEIIKSYIKTLAQVVGSEEEARFKIYSVSTKHYFAFGALVSEELSYKIKELPGVRWVLPDSYLDVKNKDYGGEPFINGEAVPYDPKYHEEWVRNNARAMERNRRNDRPRNMDRSRNFERRRENMQNFQNRAPPPPPPIQTQDLGNQSNQAPNPPNMPSQGHVPPPMPGQSAPNVGTPSFPGQGPPPNMPNAGGPNYGSYQSRLPGAHQGPPMPGSHPGPPPPMPGPNSHPGMPPRSAPNYGAPNRDHGGFQNPVPNYQNGPSPANPSYVGGGAPNPYQGGNPYQGVGNVYQGGPPGYQGGPTGYQGPPNPYQGSPGPYQAPPSNTYQGNAGGGNARQGGGDDSLPYQGQSEPDRRY